MFSRSRESFLLIILLAQWVYLLVVYSQSKHNIMTLVGEANKIMEYNLLNYSAMLTLPIHQCYHPNFVIWNA
jgi:hypothetical protein